MVAIDDGRGGSLVWLTDAEGHIFAYSERTGDLLEGAGANLVDIAPTSNEVGSKSPSSMGSTRPSAFARPISPMVRARLSDQGSTASRGILGPRLLCLPEDRQRPLPLRRHGRCPGLDFYRDQRGLIPRNGRKGVKLLRPLVFLHKTLELWRRLPT